MLRSKIVPHNGEAGLVDVTVKRPPSIFDFTPSLLLDCTTRIHPL
jgi:hypothetical protein